MLQLQSKRPKAFVLISALTCGLVASALWQSSKAGPVSFQQAVSDYNAGYYSRALEELESYKNAYPNNAQVRYYLGLCHQALNHRDQARVEFQFVSYRGSEPLKSMASKALDALGQRPGFHASQGVTSYSGSPSSSGGGSSSSVNGSHGASSASTSGASVAASSGPLRSDPEMESYLVELVNKDRSANGAAPLRMSEALNKLAREHVIDMMTNHYFDHTDKKGRSSPERAREAGIQGETHENISQSYSAGKATPRELVAKCETQMINEPPNQFNHRANILGNSRSIGVGVLINGSQVMLDQEFCDE